MNIIEHLQLLDSLIVEHTKPPVTPILRRELAFALQQCEAYQASSDKQDETLAKQVETIERLMKENQELVAKDAQADGDGHKVGVTLKNGKTVYYDANTYALLPNKNAPVTIEFRMLDKTKHTYPRGRTRHVSELHEPSG